VFYAYYCYVISVPARHKRKEMDIRFGTSGVPKKSSRMGSVRYGEKLGIWEMHTELYPENQKVGDHLGDIDVEGDSINLDNKYNGWHGVD
jgi:hypothetical protein